MNERKLNNVYKSTTYGWRTVEDIIKVLGRHTDLDKLTGKQIGELINAMYESYRKGYEEE